MPSTMSSPSPKGDMEVGDEESSLLDRSKSQISTPTPRIRLLAAGCIVMVLLLCITNSHLIRHGHSHSHVSKDEHIRTPLSTRDSDSPTSLTSFFVQPLFPRFNSSIFLQVRLSRTGIGDQATQYLHALYLASRFQVNTMMMELQQPSTRWTSFLGFQTNEWTYDTIALLQVPFIPNLLFEENVTNDSPNYLSRSYQWSSVDPPAQIQQDFPYTGWNQLENWLAEQIRGINQMQPPSQMPIILSFKHVRLPTWRILCATPILLPIARSKFCLAQLSRPSEIRRKESLWMKLQIAQVSARSAWIKTLNSSLSVCTYRPRYLLVAAHYRAGDLAFAEESNLHKRLPMHTFARSLGEIGQIIQQDFGLEPIIAVFTQRPRNETSLLHYFQPLLNHLHSLTPNKYTHTADCNHSFAPLASNVHFIGDFKSELTLLHLVRSHLFLASGSNLSQLALYLRDPDSISVAPSEFTGACHGLVEVNAEGKVDLETLRTYLRQSIEQHSVLLQDVTSNYEYAWTIPVMEEARDCARMLHANGMKLPSISNPINITKSYAEQGL